MLRRTKYFVSGASVQLAVAKSSPRTMCVTDSQGGVPWTAAAGGDGQQTQEEEERKKDGWEKGRPAHVGGHGWDDVSEEERNGKQKGN